MIDINVNMQDGHYDSIEVSGHAKYAPRGQDIVCAAVSALTCTLDRALVEIADTEEQKDLLMEAYHIGIAAIEEQYPEHVKLHLAT